MKILHHHRTAAVDGRYVHIRELTEAMETLGYDPALPALVADRDQ